VRVSEWMSEWVNEWMNEWVSEWVCVWEREWETLTAMWCTHCMVLSLVCCNVTHALHFISHAITRTFTHCRSLTYSLTCCVLTLCSFILVFIYVL
jgi:hypothetical protein